MKKRFYVYIVLFFLLIIGYMFIYSIPDDNVKIAEGVKKYFNQDKDDQYIINKIDVKQNLDIGSTRVAVILVENNNIGQVVLDKGWNKKFKIKTGFFSTGKYNAEVIRVENTNHLVISGKNELNLKYIEVELGNKTYKLDVPEGDYYITELSVPEDIKSNMGVNLKFYNKDNNNISEEMY